MASPYNSGISKPLSTASRYKPSRCLSQASAWQALFIFVSNCLQVVCSNIYKSSTCANERRKLTRVRACDAPYREFIYRTKHSKVKWLFTTRYSIFVPFIDPFIFFLFFKQAPRLQWKLLFCTHNCCGCRIASIKVITNISERKARKEKNWGLYLKWFRKLRRIIESRRNRKCFVCYH